MLLLQNYLKKYTTISSAFIDDFFSLYNHKTLDTDFVINLENLAKWLQAIKNSLKETLTKSYTKDVDYTIEKSSEKTNGRPREIIMLTPDCMKRLCMLSRTKKAEEVRTYFIKLEKHIDQYKNELFEKYEHNQKPQIKSTKEGVIYVMQSDLNLSGVYKIGKTTDFKSRMKTHQSSHEDNIKVKLVYKTEFIDDVEKCLKQYMREKQYKKYKEFYEIDIDIIKKMIDICNNVSLVAKKTINNKNFKGGYFIYIDKDIKNN